MFNQFIARFITWGLQIIGILCIVFGLISLFSALTGDYDYLTKEVEQRMDFIYAASSIGAGLFAGLCSMIAEYIAIRLGLYDENDTATEDTIEDLD